MLVVMLGYYWLLLRNYRYDFPFIWGNWVIRL
jgi:hypothetical protein